MIFRITFITLFILAGLTAASQTRKTAALSDSLFSSGTFKAAVTHYEFSPGIRKMQERILQKLSNDPEWKGRYLLRQIEEGDPDVSKLLDDFGITQSEFDTLINAFKRKKLPVFTDTLTVVVRKVNGVITFQSSGKLQLFNYLKINTRTGEIIHDIWKMAFELPALGKFYAPALYGMECGGALRPESGKRLCKRKVGYVTIGKHKGDNRPVIVLGVMFEDVFNSFDPSEMRVMTLL